MSYYRIVIYTKDKGTITGIRWYERANIDTVHLMCHRKAEAYYGRSFQDIEVQMLSKIATAVKKHMASEQKKKEGKRWPKPAVTAPTQNGEQTPVSEYNWGQNALKENAKNIAKPNQ